VVQEADDFTAISTSGVVLRARVKEVARSGRAARGVLLMTMQSGDKVASLARIANTALIESPGEKTGELSPPSLPLD
jgi:DNA gyrase/topoisomerase IV subunit A